MIRTAWAHWRGSLRQGMGEISSESRALEELSYSFARRFGDEIGTNPEELIAAAHSSCMAMALSAELGRRKLEAEDIEVKASVTIINIENGWEIPKVHLNIRADVPGASYEEVDAAVKIAKNNCPVSKLIKAEITYDFHLERPDEMSLY